MKTKPLEKGKDNQVKD